MALETRASLGSVIGRFAILDNCTVEIQLHFSDTVKPVLSGHSKIRPKLGLKTDYRFMQIKSIADSALPSTFIKLPFVIKVVFSSIFEWSLKKGFTVLSKLSRQHVYRISLILCQ